MEKLIIPTLPNILNMIGIGITIVMGVSFIVFVIGIMTNKFKIAIVGHAPIDKKSYTITRTDDAVIVNSQSEWVKNATYDIISHKDGIYYLKDPIHRHKFIELSDDELSQILASER